ncbi:sodium:solute symporter family protein [Affinibrenneria salicis]|uniref:Sodium:solute symporter family protein n=1 Tax=Affinibrenneria salicis TaxID=2590031 RepID=A0A5J5G3T6_9GAMM|nr:sodium:solute symporter family protein [Affinibrenneria salicis]KAA9000693.1 sodium:solute symporter family protein [Affinibrenneria salicis]
MTGYSALIIITLAVLLITAVGMVPGWRGKGKTLEEWAVGGRSFPRWMNWFVLAGEIYTAFAFLGASGWSYSKGAPVFYILGYASLAYVVGFWILPRLSPLGRKFNLMTQPDLVEHLYGSRRLGILVALIGIIFLIPYLQLQLTGLGMIIEVCSYGLIPREAAMIIAVIMIVSFVYLSGLHGVAYTAVVKDILMLLVIVGLGLYIPIHFFGGVGAMFHELNAARPGFLTLPGSTPNMDVAWMMSTLVLFACGFYMWPHFTASAFAAKNSDVLRHNAVYLPLYNLFLLFPMLVGFTAILVLQPALGAAESDQAFLQVVRQFFPPWMLGIIGAVGALACMIPAAELVLSTSMLFTRNVWQRTTQREMQGDSARRFARLMVIVLLAIALYFAMFNANALVNLLITGYTGVAQFFPMIVLGIFWRGATRWGAIASLAVGESLVYYLLVVKKMGVVPLPGDIGHINAGCLALAATCVVFVVVSRLTGKPAGAGLSHAGTQR